MNDANDSSGGQAHSTLFIVRINIDQVGQAKTPATATLQWSLEGNEFADADNGRFTAGTEPGIYITKPVIPVPEHARYVQLRFEPQQGGQRSIVEAYLIPGAPSIGEIFRNLVLMLFTNNLLGAMVEVNCALHVSNDTREPSERDLGDPGLLGTFGEWVAEY